MEKVRFACPKCQTIMQTGVEKVGYDVACPHCAHRFKLVERESNGPSTTADRKAGIGFDNETTLPPKRKSEFDESNQASSNAPIAPISNRSASSSNLQTSTVLGPATSPTPSASFQCPYCQTTKAPTWKSEVSQTGWIIFAVLFFTTCFGCVIGLFVRDKYRVCSECKIRLS